ncbi:DUF4190 domain-containing protein [Phycisphaeraceae bacterium D3-23]
MTQAPYPQQATRTYTPPSPQPTNGLGLAGFIVSIVGMVLCLGALCPIGAVISIPAVFKQPRGFAIAGLIIGVMGTLLWALLWVMFYVIQSQIPNYSIYDAQYQIDDYFYMHNALPDDAAGQQLVDWYEDDWDTAFRYRRIDAQNYEIISAGPDTQFGTADDQTHPFTAPNYYGNPNPGGFGNHSTSQTLEDAHDEIENTYEGEYNSPPWDRVQNTMGDRYRDEWGNNLRYNAGSGRDYELRSAGPDGQFGTPDDIVRMFTLGAEDVDDEAADAPDDAATPDPAAPETPGDAPGPTPADGA